MKPQALTSLTKTLVLSAATLTFFLISLRSVSASPASTQAPTPPPDTTVSDVRDAIRAEVQDRLAQATPLPTSTVSAVGTIISLQSTGNLLTISTARLGEKTASVSSKTTIVRVLPNGSAQQVKMDSAAIGDNIIALGNYLPGNILLAKRIILYTETAPQRLAYLANVTSTGASKITVRPAKNDSDVVFTLGGTKIQKPGGTTLNLSGVHVGDLVIIAGTKLPSKDAEADLIVRLSAAPSPKPSPQNAQP